jgi:hypothetical protein
VVSKAPLKDIISNNNAIGRVSKWGIKLASFDIDYKPRIAIKSLALVEFMADWKEEEETTTVPVVRIPIQVLESYDFMTLQHHVDPNPTMNPNLVESMLSPDPNHRILHNIAKSQS